MEIYLVISNTYMGIDGSYSRVIAAYTKLKSAQNKLKRLCIENSLDRTQHEYNFTTFSIEIVKLKGE